MKKKFLVTILLVLNCLISCNLVSFAQDNNQIQLVVSTDNNYFYPTIVCLTSVLENKKEDTKITFNILVSSDFNDNYKYKIFCLKEKYNNCKFQFWDMSNYKSNGRTREYKTKAVFYRMNLPSLMSGIDKCLYVDVDTIMNGDLSDLYGVNIDDYYVAGVKDLFKDVTYAEKLGIDSFDQYVNTGVLLMNLKKMRKDSLEEKFQQFIDERLNNNELGLLFHDQDVINATCFGKIYLLPLKYNLQLGCQIALGRDFSEQPECRQRWFSRAEWEYAVENPLILHYSDKFKPWQKDSTALHLSDWWCCAQKTGIIEEIIEKYQPNPEKLPFLFE